jgi:fibronectin type 3 domain-containing protein
VSGLSYINKNLANGATYYYKVRAYRTVSSKKVYGAYSGVVAGSTANITVAVPANVNATPATYNSNRITWGKVSGATRYELYRAISAQGTFKLVTSTTALSYTNKSLATGTEYFYKVRAYRYVGGRKIYGGYSAVVSARPVLAAPASIKAARASASGIRVSWGAVPGRTKYELWRSDAADATYAMIAATTSTYYTNTKLTAGTAWYYKVRAYRLVGKTKVYGPFTNVVSAMP